MFKKVYSLYSAFCTQPAFYSQSAVCILPLVHSLQSAVPSLRVTLTGYQIRLLVWRVVNRTLNFRLTFLIAEFNMSTLLWIIIFADQVFIDPTFFGIFVWGPLQSLVVNVCTF